MAAAEEKAGIWFFRIPSDILNPFILENASTADWRVFLTIAGHQGFRDRRTFPLSIDQTIKESGCSRRAVLRSIAWWCEIGALVKTKKRRMNVYIIPKHFTLSPGIGANSRHKTKKILKRDARGRIVPSAGTSKVPTHGTSEVPTHGTLRKARKMQNDRDEGANPRHLSGALSEVFLQKSLSRTPSPPPHRGGTVGHQKPSSDHVQILSPETINEFISLRGEAWTRQYLLDHGHVVPEGIFAAHKKADSPTQEGGKNDIPPVPQGEMMDSRSGEAT